MAADVSQLLALAATLRTSSGRVGGKAAQVVRRTAAAVERDAKALCPVDTGFLKNSIGSTVVGDGRYGSMTAEIGPTASYGSFVEHGTSRMSPQPYMGPALERNSAPFTQAISQLGDPLDEG